MDYKKVLIEILQQKALRTDGPFTLSSGKVSDYYLNTKEVLLDPEGLKVVSLLISKQLRLEEIDGIGGVLFGAAPIVCGVLMLVDRPGFLIRPEVKTYGITGNLIGGSTLVPGSKVCLMEDTTTTGGSLLKGIWEAEALGFEVVQIISVVDREEGATELLKERGYTLEVLVTKSDLLKK